MLLVEGTSPYLSPGEPDQQEKLLEHLERSLLSHGCGYASVTDRSTCYDRIVPKITNPGERYGLTCISCLRT
jgi:hypothetical protein